MIQQVIYAYFISYPHLLLTSLLPPLGNVYIADQYNDRIRKVTVSIGIITTVAGIGTASYSGDNGAATAAELSLPCGVAVDTTGTPSTDAFLM